MKKIILYSLVLVIFFIPFISFADTLGVTIQSLSPGSTVVAGSAVFFSAAATGFINPQYSVSDSVISSSLQNSAINSSGGFTWIPRLSDVGGHNITVTVTDSRGAVASASQDITVNDVASTSVQLLSPSSASVSFGQPLSFTVVTTGFTTPSFSISDSFSGGTINNSSIDSTGHFSWTPVTRDAGVHTVYISVFDTVGNHLYLSQNISVVNANMSLLLTASSSPATYVGTPFAFSATSTGLSSPTYTVTDIFPKSTVSNTNINTQGQFSWTPTSADIGTHTISVVGRDTFGHTASSITTMTVMSTSTVYTSSGASTSSGAPRSGFVFRKALSLGSKGLDVTELQKRLTSEGVYTGDVTGYYGQMTVVAVKKYQGLHGLQTLGTVGPGTRTMLNK